MLAAGARDWAGLSRQRGKTCGWFWVVAACPKEKTWVTQWPGRATTEEDIGYLTWRSVLDGSGCRGGDALAAWHQDRLGQQAGAA
jgi:hypothetical protein